MKINIIKSVLLEDVDVEIIPVLDDNGCIECIDIVSYCKDCDEFTVYQRFLPIGEDLLEEMLDQELLIEEDCKCCMDIKRHRN